MKHKTINTIILATALSVAGLTHAVAASDETNATETQTYIMKEDGQGKHRNKNDMRKMGFKKLNLTDEQKAEMKAIMASHREANKETKLAHKAEMKALMEDPAFDEEKAQALINQREAQRADKQLSMLKLKHQMFQVLTDEQKAKYEELQMQGKKGHKGKNRPSN